MKKSKIKKTYKNLIRKKELNLKRTSTKKLEETLIDIDDTLKYIDENKNSKWVVEPELLISHLQITKEDIKKELEKRKLLI